MHVCLCAYVWFVCLLYAYISIHCAGLCTYICIEDREDHWCLPLSVFPFPYSLKTETLTESGAQRFFIFVFLIFQPGRDNFQQPSCLCALTNVGITLSTYMATGDQVQMLDR